MIWIDSGTNFASAGVELVTTNLGKEFAVLERSYRKIEFRTTFPKHHQGIGACERMVGYIKNSVMHNVKGIQASQMSNQEFLTWLARITSIVNDRPLILAAPLGLSLTPNDILQFKSGDFVGSWENETKVGKQLERVKRCLDLFRQSWEAEFSRRSQLVPGGKKSFSPEVRDIVLVKGESGDRMILGLVVELHHDSLGDVYGATVEYRRSIGGKLIRVKRHLSKLCPFMEGHKHELGEPMERVRVVEDDPVVAPHVVAGAGEVVLDELDETPDVV